MKHDLVVEIFYGDDWHELPVYTRDPVTITRGRQDQLTRVSPSTMDLSVDNRSGDYGIRNPESPLWGLVGRNTPIRSAVRHITDTFTRTVSDGWGSTDTGEAWTTFHVGGADADFDVAAGVGTMVVDTAAEHRSAWLADTSYRDVELAVTVDTTITNVTGGSIEPGNLLMRVQSVNVYYMARVVVTTAEAVQIKLMHEDTGVTTELATATVSGLTYSGQALRVRAQVEGTVLRAKVWDATGGEPFDWQVTVTDTTITAAGGVGVRNGVASGNTNIPVTFTMDDFEVRDVRFHGEVEAWPQRWNITGSDVWAPITGRGILHRLGLPGQASLARNALYRANTVGPLSSSLVAYWSLDEGSSAGIVANVTGGSTAVLASTVLPGASPELAGVPVLVGYTPNVTTVEDGQQDVLLELDPHTPSGDYVLTWWHQFLPDLVGNGAPYPNLQNRVDDITPIAAADSLPSGNVRHRFEFTDTRIDVQHLMAAEESSEDQINAFCVTAGSSAQIRWSLDHDLAAGWHEIQIRLEQDGSDVGAQLYFDGTLVQGQDFVGGVPQTAEDTPDFLSRTMGTLLRARLGALGSWGDPLIGAPSNEWMPYAVGHFTVHDSWSAAQGYAAGLGHVGETAGDRIERLLTEDGISVTIIGDTADTAAMGPQGVLSTLELCHEAADADAGILHEPRGAFGITYRTRVSLYNQDAALALDYAAGGEVAPPLEPTDDTDHVANDVRVTRQDGATGRAVQESGPLNVQEPADDPQGVGRYAVDYTLNLYEDAQTTPQAGWRKNLGTVDEPRYPTILVDLDAMDLDGKTALARDAVALNVGGRLTIANPPAWQGPEDIDQHAQGFVETIESHHRTIAINATPAAGFEVFELDTSRLAAETSTTNEALDTTETAVDVISDTPWADSTGYASEFPFDVVIGGERMTVTACTGTGLTQVFTVTRSANGVVKSHDTLSPIQLHRPTVLSL